MHSKEHEKLLQPLGKHAAPKAKQGQQEKYIRIECSNLPHCPPPATRYFTSPPRPPPATTHTCPAPLGVNLSAGPGSSPGRRLRGLACRLLLLFIVRLPSSCSLGLKVSSSGGLLAER